MYHFEHGTYESRLVVGVFTMFCALSTIDMLQYLRNKYWVDPKVTEYIVPLDEGQSRYRVDVGPTTSVVVTEADCSVLVEDAVVAVDGSDDDEVEALTAVPFCELDDEACDPPIPPPTAAATMMMPRPTAKTIQNVRAARPQIRFVLLVGGSAYAASGCT